MSYFSLSLIRELLLGPCVRGDDGDGEDDIEEISESVHKVGGLMYMDGANLNAMIGLCQPIKMGFDILTSKPQHQGFLFHEKDDRLVQHLKYGKALLQF